jgi:hypothetical protein
MEPIYRVSFFKTLVDSTGHPVDACQGVIEVHAPSEERAIDEARIEFAKLKQVMTWRLRADYAKAERLCERWPVVRRHKLLRSATVDTMARRCRELPEL